MTNDALLSGDYEASDNEVAFDYIKAPGFRITWLDGAIGSVTPTGNIQVTFYAERPAIPQRQVFKSDDKGELNEVISKRISRESVVREMSMDAMMTAETAESLAEFLLGVVQQLKDEEE